MTPEIAAYVFGISVIPTAPFLRDLPDLEPFDAAFECEHGRLPHEGVCDECEAWRLGVAA